MDGIPFSVVMNHAVALKKARSATFRSVFDRYPKYFQNSVFFCSNDFRGLQQSKCFKEKIFAANQLRELGNEFFHRSNFIDALDLYEKSLAIFKYLENKDKNWKHEVCFTFLPYLLLKISIAYFCKEKSILKLSFSNR